MHGLGRKRRGHGYGGAFVSMNSNAASWLGSQHENQTNRRGATCLRVKPARVPNKGEKFFAFARAIQTGLSWLAREMQPILDPRASRTQRKAKDIV